MNNLGFSEGNVDTDGTFINSLGGQSYLPLYRGRETSDDYQFDLPEHINLIAHYQEENFSSDTLNFNYVARYKRQGTVNFYYAGVKLGFEKSTLNLMLDLENLSPEVQYQSEWFDVIFAIDELELEKDAKIILNNLVKDIETKKIDFKNWRGIMKNFTQEYYYKYFVIIYLIL